MQHLRTTVDARALMEVVVPLAFDESGEVVRCIPDDLIPDVLRMTDALSKPYDYDDYLVRQLMPRYGCLLKKKVTRIKGELAGE